MSQVSAYNTCKKWTVEGWLQYFNPLCTNEELNPGHSAKPLSFIMSLIQPFSGSVTLFAI
jgi:hypothetical protein